MAADAIPGNFPRSYHAPQDDRDYIGPDRGAVPRQGPSTVEGRPQDQESEYPRDGDAGARSSTSAEGGGTSN